MVEAVGFFTRPRAGRAVDDGSRFPGPGHRLVGPHVVEPPAQVGVAILHEADLPVVEAAIDLHIRLGDGAVPGRFAHLQGALVLGHLQPEGVGVVHPGPTPPAAHHLDHQGFLGEGGGNGQIQRVLAGGQRDHRGQGRLEDARLVSVAVGEGVPAEEEFRVHAVVVHRHRRQSFPGDGDRPVLHLKVEGCLA